MSKISHPITKKLHELEDGTLIRLPGGQTPYTVRHFPCGTRRGRIHYGIEPIGERAYMYPNVKKVVLLNDDGTDKIKTYNCYCCGTEMRHPNRVEGYATYCPDCKVCAACGLTTNGHKVIANKPYCSKRCQPKKRKLKLIATGPAYEQLLLFCKREGITCNE
jgi:hypothetical protein